ncbi:MAG: hypothetical protein EP318_21330 [Rhodobacteraceae bacterium]|nr:MAG: hypothetical protein EP318_21330 [Paracoccaceae bacterium]
MRRLLLWALLLPVLAALALAAPVIWVETACRSPVTAETYQPILPPEHRRAEARTLLTYPEWHIVHAYDDYAEVIRTGDPHDFGYFRAISGFWSSLCALSQASGAHGGFPAETRQMVHVIGVSFTAEMVAKAAYEETLGRVATWVRGRELAPLDHLSARQAAEYAAFLQQVPWYKWDFRADAAEVKAAAPTGFRDRERQVALGLEYGAKALYAGVIEAAVAQVGPDALRLRMVVTGLSAADLAGFDGVEVMDTRPEGIEIDAPRYRELTHLLAEMAGRGADFVEIAGNDDILLTAITDVPQEGALYRFARQGYGDWRELVKLRVADLAEALRAMEGGPRRLEHIHDY